MCKLLLSLFYSLPVETDKLNIFQFTCNMSDSTYFWSSSGRMEHHADGDGLLSDISAPKEFNWVEM